MSNDDAPRPRSPMGQKPRVPVGPRRTSTGSSGAPTGPSGSTGAAPPRGDDPTVHDSRTPPARTRASSANSSAAKSGDAQRLPASTSKTTARERPSNKRPPSTASKPRFTARRVFGYLIALIVLANIAGFATLAALFEYYGRALPDVRNLRTAWRPPQTTRVLARDGSVLAELFLERRTVVPIERFPVNLVKAFLAAEDAEFYVHRGLDYPGMLRALWVNIRTGTTAQGASTITQQVVKNVLLTPERTLARKVREVLLARRIESQLGKNEILYLYLNQIGFGHGRNGVEEAARFYFGKHVEQLTLGECVLLAGIPKNPTHYSPRNDPEAARRRRHWILGQMVRNRFVTQAEADAADAEPIRLAESDDDEGSAPEVVEAARAVLRQVAGEEALRRGGYTITTTIDPELERAAREALRAGLRELDTRQGYVGPLPEPGTRRVRGRPGYVLAGEAPPADGRLVPGRIYGGLVEGTVDPDPSAHREGVIQVRVGRVVGRVSWNSAARYVRGDSVPSTFAPRGAVVRVSVDRAAPPGDESVPMRLELGPQAALVALDPSSREVRALVGGYEPIAGMFDRATRAQRQPGSSFKTVLYSLALSSRRYTLASTVDPNAGCLGTWCPHEAHATHDGVPELPMRLREALAQSRNMVAARVVLDVGPQALVEHANRLGITGRMNATPALALGTGEVTPAELTNVYATWAAGGRVAPYTLVSRIVGPDGRDVALPTKVEPRDALTRAEAYLVTSMLTSVVDHGTGQRARVLHRPVAGKTGTSNDARDAWFVGYSPDLVVGSWVGFDDRQPLGRGEEGARSALPIWVRFFESYVRSRHPPAVDFPRPDGLVTLRIDPRTGLRAPPEQLDAIDEVFLSGTEPSQIAVPSALPGDGGTPVFTPLPLGDASVPALGVPVVGAPPLVPPSASAFPSAPAVPTEVTEVSEGPSAPAPSSEPPAVLPSASAPPSEPTPEPVGIPAAP